MIEGREREGEGRGEEINVQEYRGFERGEVRWRSDGGKRKR